MAKISAFGTWLTYIDPDSGEQDRIHYVADISGPEVMVETVDVTRDVERIVTVDVQGPDQPSTSPGPPPVSP